MTLLASPLIVHATRLYSASFWAFRRIVCVLCLVPLFAISSPLQHAQAQTTPVIEELSTDDTKASEDRPEENLSEKPPSVTLLPEGDIDTWYSSIASRMQDFFERDDRNVNVATFETIARHVKAFSRWMQERAQSAWKRPTQTALLLAPILAALLLGPLASVGVFWQLRKIVTRARDRLEKSTLKPWAKLSLRLLLHILLHLVPPLTLQLVFIVTLALYSAPSDPVLVLLRGFGWLIFEYCAIRAIITSIVQRPLDCLEERNPGSLGNILLFAVFLVVVCQSLLLIVTTYRLGQDISNVILIGLYLALSGVAVGLIPRKKDILALIETSGKGTINARLKSALDSYYGGFLGALIILLLFWAVGFTRAASFLLIRGYSLVGLVAVLGLIQRRVEHAFQQREQLARTDAQKAYLDLVHSGVKACLLFATLWISLEIVSLYDAAFRVVDYPLLLIGSARFSLWTLVKAIFSIFFSIYLSRLLRPLLDAYVYPRFQIDISVTYAINTVIHYVLLGVGIAASLNALQVDFSAFLVVAGALGVGIGLGLQNITHNLISGFILLFGRSVRKGDSVTVDGHYGVVEAVGARAVTLMTPDRTEVIIPSSHLVSQPIVNYSYTSPTVRVKIPVGVHYQSDVRQVEQALLNAALRHKHILRDPAPTVWLENFGDNSVNFTLLIYINIRSIDIPRLRGEINFHIWDVLKEQGIEIPYPQRDIHIKDTHGLRRITHALRREDPPSSPEDVEAPKLDIIPSYLNRSKTRPQLPNDNIRNVVMDHIRNNPMDFDPKRRVRETVDHFFQARTNSLEKAAERVCADLERLSETDSELNMLEESLFIRNGVSAHDTDEVEVEPDTDEVEVEPDADEIEVETDADQTSGEDEETEQDSTEDTV